MAAYRVMAVGNKPLRLRQRGALLQSALIMVLIAVLGQNQFIVRLHEPEQLRQEKLASRFGSGSGNGQLRSASGATSPTPSEGGKSMVWPLPSVRSISPSMPAPITSASPTALVAVREITAVYATTNAYLLNDAS